MNTPMLYPRLQSFSPARVHALKVAGCDVGGKMFADMARK